MQTPRRERRNTEGGGSARGSGARGRSQGRSRAPEQHVLDIILQLLLLLHPALLRLRLLLRAPRLGLPVRIVVRRRQGVVVVAAARGSGRLQCPRPDIIGKRVVGPGGKQLVLLAIPGREHLVPVGQLLAGGGGDRGRGLRGTDVGGGGGGPGVRHGLGRGVLLPLPLLLHLLDDADHVVRWQVEFGGTAAVFPWGVAVACCYPRSAEEEHASPQPPAPYLAGAGARAGIPRHGAGQATRTANQVSGVGSLRSPEGRVRTARGDRSSPNAELERGCGVCAAAQCRTRAGGSGFGCCGRLPPRCSAGPARRLRGAETLATRRKPGPDLEWTQGGLGAGN
uniref:Uncharacterized protein n=1 Tax=Mustela putorius furo TaxID=9669 RepID=M3YWQ1_MUSPF